MRIAVGLLLILAACSRSAPAPGPARAVEFPGPSGGDPLAGIVEAHNEVRRSARPVPSPALPPLVEAPELIAAAPSATAPGGWSSAATNRPAMGPGSGPTDR